MLMKMRTKKDELIKFLDKKGAIEILVAIGLDGARFSNIESNVVISHDTIPNRIDEARKLGLVETEKIAGRTPSVKYMLTKTGENCYIGLCKYDIVGTHQRYVEAISNYKKLTKSVVSNLEERGNDEWVEWWLDNETRAKLRNPRKDSSELNVKDRPDIVEKAAKEGSLDLLDELDDLEKSKWDLETKLIINSRLEDSSSN